MNGNVTVVVAADSSDVHEACGHPDGAYTLVRTRTIGETEGVLDGSVEAVIVAEQLPDGTGTELLRVADERGIDLRAGLLTPRPGTGCEWVDVEVAAPPTGADLERAIDRLLSLRRYDREVDRLYDLAKQQSGAGGDDAAVGDGGVNYPGEEVVAARDSADSALADVPVDDYSTLMSRPSTGTGGRVTEDSA